MPADDDYDLKTLLQLRNRERDDAEKRYARAMTVHGDLAKKVQRLETKHRKMVRDRRNKCQQFDDQLLEGSASMAKIQKFDHYLAGLREREEQAWNKVESARREKTEARTQMEKARRSMLEAVRQVKAVEEHYEKWKEKKKLDNKRRQAAKMDDVAARMWRQNRQ